MPAPDAIVNAADQLFAAIERSDEPALEQQFSDGFVQHHILHATGGNGGSIALRVSIVIKLNSSALISRIDEYFDPAGLAALMS